MLEVFGEHMLSAVEIVGLLAISMALIVAYEVHGTHEQFPLLNLKLFRIRTFRVAAAGSFFTRLGIGGVPFLLPLLYQVGLGYSPVASGLLIMPQAVASMTVKLIDRPAPESDRVSGRPDFKHRHDRRSFDAVCDDRAAHLRLGDCAACVLLRWLHFRAIHEYEHACLCRYSG